MTDPPFKTLDLLPCPNCGRQPRMRQEFVYGGFSESSARQK